MLPSGPWHVLSPWPGPVSPSVGPSLSLQGSSGRSFPLPIRSNGSFTHATGVSSACLPSFVLSTRKSAYKGPCLPGVCPKGLASQRLIITVNKQNTEQGRQ